MKTNRQNGFLLVETLIVTVFVMTLFLFIYRNVVPLIGEYTRRENYDDIDSVYAASLIRNLILSDGNYDSLVAGIDNEHPYKDISDCNLYQQKNLCNTLKEQLNITQVIDENNNVVDGKIYLSRYELTRLKRQVSEGTIFNNNTERGIREYISYLPNYTSKDLVIGYRVIIVRNARVGEDLVPKYANIEVVK